MSRFSISQIPRLLTKYERRRSQSYYSARASTTSSPLSYYTTLSPSSLMPTSTPTGMSTVSSKPTYQTTPGLDAHSDDEDMLEALPDLTPRLQLRNRPLTLPGPTCHRGPPGTVRGSSAQIDRSGMRERLEPPTPSTPRNNAHKDLTDRAQQLPTAPSLARTKGTVDRRTVLCLHLSQQQQHHLLLHQLLEPVL
ncbi:hypothetical protein EI94DRAFT_1820999 [Lactarius quietus]|nr:hypothetical protein EI94DRAFT_1820999 [Lactarius quietus]